MESLIYANYHRHSNYSIVVAGGDSVVKNEEYVQMSESIVKDLRKNGQIIADGKVVQKNGRWLI